MSSEVKNTPLIKTVYSQESNTVGAPVAFTFFKEQEQSTGIDTPPTVEEFFKYYQTLFYEIPKQGENSHSTLVTQSQEYIGPVEDTTYDALIAEIDNLRKTNLELLTQLTGK